MPNFTDNIHIDAPRARVWAALADLGAIQDFHPGLRASHWNDGPRAGVGASRHCDLKPFGSIDETATHWEDGRAMTLELHDIKNGPPLERAEARIRLADAPHGTIVSITIEYEMRFGLLGKLMDRLVVRGQLNKGIGGLLRGLRTHVEPREVLDLAPLAAAAAA